jgi:hypothetical protein
LCSLRKTEEFIKLVLLNIEAHFPLSLCMIRDMPGIHGNLTQFNPETRHCAV